jgi:uncharacterized membrane protein
MQDMAPVAMARANPASTARIAMHPIHPMLVPFPIACFVGTLLTDLAYWKTAEMMWADFSSWLLFAGLVMGVLAAIALGLMREGSIPRFDLSMRSVPDFVRDCAG